MNKQQQNCKKKRRHFEFSIIRVYVQDNLEEWFHDFTKEMIERQIS